MRSFKSFCPLLACGHSRRRRERRGPPPWWSGGRRRGGASPRTPHRTLRRARLPAAECPLFIRHPHVLFGGCFGSQHVVGRHLPGHRPGHALHLLHHVQPAL